MFVWQLEVALLGYHTCDSPANNVIVRLAPPEDYVQFMDSCSREAHQTPPPHTTILFIY